MGDLEVSLRNAMHRELVAYFKRSDWWHAPSARLHGRAQDMVETAADILVRQHKSETPGRMVAELSFGFWVSLLSRGNDYETRLWRPALRHVFPGYRGRRDRLYTDLNHIRTFRNRIAHHEPIHHRHLAADHETVLRLTGYIEPEMQEYVRSFDRVPEVLSRSPAPRGPSA